MISEPMVYGLAAMFIFLVIYAVDNLCKKIENQGRKGEATILKNNDLYDKKIIEGRRKAERMMRLKKWLKL